MAAQYISQTSLARYNYRDSPANPSLVAARIQQAGAETKVEWNAVF